MIKDAKRYEDMSPEGCLVLHMQNDGDIQIYATGQNHHGDYRSVQIEFCLSGGQSYHTLEALRQLMAAMQRDEEERPQYRGNDEKPV